MCGTKISLLHVPIVREFKIKSTNHVGILSSIWLTQPEATPEVSGNFLQKQSLIYIKQL